MKLALLIALLAPVSAVIRHTRGGLVKRQGAKVVVLPEDKDECVAKMGKLIKEPMTKSYAIDYATDGCARDKRANANNYVCPHFKELLQDAFKDFPDGKKMSADEFCDVTEFHVLRMRGATRVSNVGTGSILNFTIVEDCEKTVLGAMQPEKELDRDQVPDFWYSLCINQDCAHFLPSRTKWCKVDKTPTHGIEVCQLLRDFAIEKVGGWGTDLKPKKICALYDEFVDEVKEGIEAYDHYIHGESREHVPTPSDRERALRSSQLLNDAQGHKLRDNAGEPVKAKSVAAPLAATAALALTLAAVMA